MGPPKVQNIRKRLKKAKEKTGVLPTVLFIFVTGLTLALVTNLRMKTII